MKPHAAAPLSRPASSVLACLILLAAGLFAFYAPGEAVAAKSKATKSGVLKGNPGNKRLASEFLRLLEAKDTPGLKRFLDPAFLLQRADGDYLTKSQYLVNQAVVDEFRIRRVVGKRSGDVRVIRFEAHNVETINGEPVPAKWIPRLSTFTKRSGAWRLIGHANFSEPVTS